MSFVGGRLYCFTTTMIAIDSLQLMRGWGESCRPLVDGSQYYGELARLFIVLIVEVQTSAVLRGCELMMFLRVESVKPPGLKLHIRQTEADRYAYRVDAIHIGMDAETNSRGDISRLSVSKVRFGISGYV